ncbi:uncharacterized protein B0H18DRAFT_958756 [Fomitopsis serialis]|uniref:uncharacterized protein n=1 Tax=Fomitopsis serialis TaxID=139415 RepID=UPI00200804A8|nr:uncharacterized protein B0H18DRAFT_958756 [Neoantrodia serialis]KAH9916702.1 hypothetical protein B0H18DRAFT_958756 [Neoantrodia serialis]
MSFTQGPWDWREKLDTEQGRLKTTASGGRWSPLRALQETTTGTAALRGLAGARPLLEVSRLQLNSKLVKSYDRMSNVEDEPHVTTSNLRGATLKIGELELERAQHLSAPSSGPLVEKDHITTALNHLMKCATDEAAQHSQVESARAQIEKELADLSAGLFNQASSIVAKARIAQAKSERKEEGTELGMLQTQMQTLQAEKERADGWMEDMRATMGNGNDPTVRLDLAPSLNWLSRRSVISAIHGGELSIESMPTLVLLQELAPSAIPGQSHNTHISCALCGTSIIYPSNSASVYIFRIAMTSSGLPVSLPLSPQNNTQAKPTIYPLCTAHWCLTRLRATCSMWAFVRMGIVEKIWDDGVYMPPASLRTAQSPAATINGTKRDGFGAAEADEENERRT